MTTAGGRWRRSSNPGRKSAEAPYDINVPGTIYDVGFMVRDAKGFPSGGWGYAVFKYDAEAGGYAPATTTHRPPQANDPGCGTAGHNLARAKDFVFTEYATR